MSDRVDFSSNAAISDRRHQALLPRGVVNALASAAELKTGSRVLDVGAGTGRVALALADDYGCSVVALEPSLSMLDELQRKRGDRGLVVSSFMNGATVMSDSPWAQARENSGPSLKKPGSTNRSTLVRAPREMLIHISTIWS